MEPRHLGCVWLEDDAQAPGREVALDAALERVAKQVKISYTTGPRGASTAPRVGFVVPAWA